MRFQESLYPAWGQNFGQTRVLFEHQTDHQHLVIFENDLFGRVMALDGVTQTTSRDEFVYHEMMVHVPLLTHPNPQRILIIGGGDGGILREVCKHRGVTHITQVEIDASVVEMCKTYFPNHSAGSFDDPRLTLVIDDGATFVRQCKGQFDVIIADSTDPIGPAEVLFETDFYRHCADLLSSAGILVTQNGVPFLQGQELTNTFQRWKGLFATRWCYLTTVPTYVGGPMAMGFASPSAMTLPDLKTLHARTEQLQGLKYYTPEAHLGAFGLPLYVQKLLVDSGMSPNRNSS